MALTGTNFCIWIVFERLVNLLSFQINREEKY